MKIQFEKDRLTVEQNNYLTKCVNFYIVCNLDASPRNSTISNLRTAYFEQQA